MGEQVKVRFDVQSEPVRSETVWAERIGQDLYRLLNVPFYATGYAEGDLVRCDSQSEGHNVIAVEEHSGNGTVRIMFADSTSPEATTVLEQLVSVGCTYERASPMLVGVTVPPTLQVPFSQMANYLNSISDDVILGWEIGKRLTRPVT